VGTWLTLPTLGFLDCLGPFEDKIVWFWLGTWVLSDRTTSFRFLLLVASDSALFKIFGMSWPSILLTEYLLYWLLYWILLVFMFSLLLLFDFDLFLRKPIKKLYFYSYISFESQTQMRLTSFYILAQNISCY
jgi:hypothetical protein